MTNKEVKKVRHFRMTDESYKALQSLDPMASDNATNALLYLIRKGVEKTRLEVTKWALKERIAELEKCKPGEIEMTNEVDLLIKELEQILIIAKRD